MTIQASYGLMVPSPALLPQNAIQSLGVVGVLLIDATAEKVAWIFRAPKTGTLARAHFRTGTVTTGDTLKVSFQDVDTTTGSPDGTADQYRTQVIADGDDNVWFRTSILSSDGTDGGTKRAVVAGDLVALVIEFNSYVAGNLNIATGSISSRFPFAGTSYLSHFTAAWAKQPTLMPAMAVEYEDGSFAFIPGALPSSAVGSVSIGTGSTPDEAGLLITLPYKARVWGAWVAAYQAGSDASLVLYDTDGATVLDSATMDKDVHGGFTGVGAHAVQFTSAPTLSAWSTYRLAYLPLAASINSLGYFDVHTTPGAAILDQMDGGSGIHWTQRTNGGAWSETTTRRAVMGLILSGLDDGASRGGRMRQVSSKRHRRAAA